ncbi:crotonase/enoyl-CoA hydratase family protein [Celeribacter ethanolicus]|uniref:crotonase/enoyl-CoA hydratase family protein n=1 Tax=Celeribacter ethanolicus TaxID=1758178 RepID=UPI00082EE7D0|nr:crotonase/enoyl-CoA hydratase family protein [Celeribacter ethanolicus]TNE64455.1 MAG: crotonase/enoyl-CoA hydratase family protein [Paracoccaceae bacterium]
MTVTLTIENHIAHLTLNRPDKMNAVTEGLIADLLARVAEIAASDARVVLLAGAGKAFCAGLDTSNFQRFMTEDLDALVMERTHGDANAFQAFSLALHDLPIPVIAAIHGPCFGAGMQLAIAADIRIASPEAQLSIMEMKWGLVPDMGGMVLFPRVLRSDVLRLLTYTNEIVPAARAAEFGLVTEIAEDAMTRALEIATTIAGKSPTAMRAVKRLIGTAESSHDRAHILMEESREQRALIGTPHQIETVMAQMQKRPPVYD